MVTMLKNKRSVWKRIKFPTFWYNCYYFTWLDNYFIQLETLLINHPSYISRARWIQFTYFYFLTTHFDIILPFTSRSSKLTVFFMFFLFKTVGVLFCVWLATYPTHLIVLRFIILTVFDEEYGARSSFYVREGLAFKCKSVNDTWNQSLWYQRCINGFVK